MIDYVVLQKVQESFGYQTRLRGIRDTFLIEYVMHPPPEGPCLAQLRT